MKKAFDTLLITLGVIGCSAVLLLIAFVFLTSINENTGKAIAGTTKTIKGTVTGIACHTGINDISFTVKGADRNYYINRGLEKGLSCDDLRRNLIDKEVEISYVDLWLDPRDISAHINRLSYNGKPIYSELKD